MTAERLPHTKDCCCLLCQTPALPKVSPLVQGMRQGFKPGDWYCRCTTEPYAKQPSGAYTNGVDHARESSAYTTHTVIENQARAMGLPPESVPAQGAEFVHLPAKEPSTIPSDAVVEDMAKALESMYSIFAAPNPPTKDPPIVQGVELDTLTNLLHSGTLPIDDLLAEFGFKK